MAESLPKDHAGAAAPIGRDEVRAALLEAATRRFAAEGTSATLRDIAADAQVNLGLVHRHVGNKDDLLRAVVASTSRSGADMVTAAPDLPAAITHMFHELANDDSSLRIIAWLLLSGESTDRFQTEFPTMDALRARVNGADEELRLVAALSMLFGWTVWGQQILHTLKYPESAVDEVRAEVAKLAGELLPAAKRPRSNREGHR